MPQLLKLVGLDPLLCNERSHHSEEPTHSNDDPSQLHPPHGGCGRRDRSDPGDLMMEAPSVVTGARAGLSLGLTEQIEFVFEM